MHAFVLLLGLGRAYAADPTTADVVAVGHSGTWTGHDIEWTTTIEVVPADGPVHVALAAPLPAGVDVVSVEPWSVLVDEVDGRVVGFDLPGDHRRHTIRLSQPA